MHLRLSFKLLFPLIMLISCSGPSKQGFDINLSGRWEFRQLGDSLWKEAVVPGTVHTDLYKNVLVDDPFYRTNEKDQQWIDQKDWEYRKIFFIDKNKKNSDRINLEFRGLDTYTKIFLNGNELPGTNNMFRTWRFEVKKLLKFGDDNDLRVILKSPTATIRSYYDSLPYHLPAVNDQAREKLSVYTRKAPYHYGWDWGPRFVTSGIWRPVILEGRNSAEIESIYYRQNEIDPNEAKLTAEVEVYSNIKQRISLQLSDVNSSSEPLANISFQLKEGINILSVDFTIINPILWWTNGLGEQHLYAIKARVEGKDFIDEKTEKIGIRSVELIREPDQFGESFYFKINGIPVFMKGANYIPNDNFLNHVVPKEYHHIVSSARDANMNMLRVWGGGIYEEDYFYQLCDEMGILVWQDFMFACSMYPGDESFLSNVKQEAVDNVKRLRNHPCIALWCGNNEMGDAWAQWGWQNFYSPEQKKEISANYKRLFHQILPDIITALDPQRRYWPSSPASGTQYGQTSKLDQGDFHYWGVWHGRRPFESFAEMVPRFSSEYGFQSFPELKTVKSFTIPEDQSIDSEVMKAHQRHPIGNQLILNYMERYYPVPQEFDEFLYVSQVMQGEGMRFGMEALRRSRPRCMGSLYWQLNDCWPVASWSGIDYFGRWKALHYQAARAYAPLLPSFEISDDSVALFIISDNMSETPMQTEISLIDFDGRIWYQHEFEVSVPKLSSTHVWQESIQNLLKDNSSSRELVIEVQLTDQNGEKYKNHSFFRPAKDLKLSKDAIDYEIVDDDPENILIRISARSLARQIYLRYDGESEIRFEDNYFDLLPNQIKEIRVKKFDRESFFGDKVRILTINNLSTKK